MSPFEEIYAKEELGKREREILRVLLNCGGKATWKDFEKALVPDKMQRRTLSKGLRTLVELNIVVKRREFFRGRKTWVYVFQSKEVLEIFDKMNNQLLELTKRFYAETLKPGLSTSDRVKRLVNGVRTLLEYQRALTLMAIKLAIEAGDEETACRRFIKLMNYFTIMAAGEAFNLCWLNRNVAMKALNITLPKVKDY